MLNFFIVEERYILLDLQDKKVFFGETNQTGIGFLFNLNAIAFMLFRVKNT